MSIRTERPARPIISQNGEPTDDEIIKALRPAPERDLENESKTLEPFAAIDLFAARMKGPGIELGAPYATGAPFPAVPTLSPAASTPPQYAESDPRSGRIQLFAEGDSAAPKLPQLADYRGRALTAQLMTRIFTAPNSLLPSTLNVEVRCKLRGNSVLFGGEGTNTGFAATYVLVNAHVLRMDDPLPSRVGSSSDLSVTRMRSNELPVPPVTEPISLDEWITFSVPAVRGGRYVVLVNVFAAAVVGEGSTLYAGLDFANRGSAEATGVWIPQILVKY